jgi:hypothetical protein
VSGFRVKCGYDIVVPFGRARRSRADRRRRSGRARDRPGTGPPRRLLGRDRAEDGGVIVAAEGEDRGAGQCRSARPCPRSSRRPDRRRDRRDRSVDGQDAAGPKRPGTWQRWPPNWPIRDWAVPTRSSTRSTPMSPRPSTRPRTVSSTAWISYSAIPTRAHRSSRAMRVLKFRISRNPFWTRRVLVDGVVTVHHGPLPVDGRAAGRPVGDTHPYIALAQEVPRKLSLPTTVRHALLR